MVCPDCSYTKEELGQNSYVRGPIQVEQVYPTRKVPLNHTGWRSTVIAQAKAKYFTVFDALKGYHQCPLDEASQNLMTFILFFTHSSIYITCMVYHRSVSITTDAWKKPLLACTTFARLLMTYLSKQCLWLLQPSISQKRPASTWMQALSELDLSSYRDLRDHMKVGK